MYFLKIDFEVGDVFCAREHGQGENGLIVQAFESTTSYPQTDSKGTDVPAYITMPIRLNDSP